MIEWFSALYGVLLDSLVAISRERIKGSYIGLFTKNFGHIFGIVYSFIIQFSVMS